MLGIAEMHARALIEAQKAVEVDANMWFPHFAIAFNYAASGELELARAPAERSVRAAPWQAHAVGLLTGILARLGETQRADELVRKLSDMPPFGRLFYHLLNSSDDTTVDWYATMVQNRDPTAVPFNVLKPLRASPRWPALAKMMNLPPEAV